MSEVISESKKKLIKWHPKKPPQEEEEPLQVWTLLSLNKYVSLDYMLGFIVSK